MGIDIGFADASLKTCKYALCRPYRSKIAAIYSELPEQGEDKLKPYRQVDKVVNMNLLELEEPTVYHELTKDEPPFARQSTWYWNKAWFKDYYTDREKSRTIRPYIEDRPSGRVLLSKMPQELRQQWIAETEEENLVSAWWQLPYERHREICRPCPIRPLQEDNCYLRFSNYPGMNSFRQGFMLTVFYAAAFDEQKLNEALFCFPHLDRQKGELPKDKIGQLHNMCQGTPINKGAESFFNSVVEMLEKVKPPELESDTSKIDMTDVPFVDEFISKFIYREEPYSLDETRKLLPYFETLQELADWAIFDTDHRELRNRLIGFRDRFDSLVTALRTADKYGLEVSMSY